MEELPKPNTERSARNCQAEDIGSSAISEDEAEGGGDEGDDKDKDGDW